MNLVRFTAVVWTTDLVTRPGYSEPTHINHRYEATDACKFINMDHVQEVTFRNDIANPVAELWFETPANDGGEGRYSVVLASEFFEYVQDMEAK